MNGAELILIKRALLEAEEIHTSAIDSLPDVDTSFFPDFDIKVREADAAARRAVRLSSKRWIAVLIAAAILVCLTVTALAFRERIASFVEEIFSENSKLLSNAPTEAPIAEGVYHPTYFPGEYKQTTLNESHSTVQTVWVCDAERIILKQSIVGGQSLTLDTEYESYEKIYVGSATYYYVSKNGQHLLSWSNEKYTYSLVCTSGMTKDEVMQIATSLALVSEESKA